MPALYEYICTDCKDKDTVVEDKLQPGHFLEFRAMSARDEVAECPNCKAPSVRNVVPDNVTVWWGNPYNAKKTCLGPSIDYYPPTRDAKRKQATRHIDMSPVGESARILKEDASKAPSAADRPSPGVSKAKGD